MQLGWGFAFKERSISLSSKISAMQELGFPRGIIPQALGSVQGHISLQVLGAYTANAPSLLGGCGIWGYGRHSLADEVHICSVTSCRARLFRVAAGEMLAT